jgi:hypothetical protein
LTERIKDRLLRTQAMRNFRRDLDEWVRARFLRVKELKGAQRLRHIVRRKVIMPQAIISLWKDFVKGNHTPENAKQQGHLDRQNGFRSKNEFGDTKKLREIIRRNIVVPQRVIAALRLLLITRTKASRRIEIVDKLSHFDYLENEKIRISLKQLINRVAFIPETHIKKVSTVLTEPCSSLETYRRGLESFTQMNWNWWPMKPLRREKRGDRIIKWQCVGEILFYEISSYIV